jgi:hypothetical protein
MSALGFTDQRARLGRILENSIEGAAYESSETEEGGRMVVLRARRPDGQRVAVRFRAVSSSDASEDPQAGATLSLRSISVNSGGCLSLLSPFWLFRRGPFGAPVADSARVTIDAGAARLDIVCQDAEWWEDAGTA